MGWLKANLTIANGMDWRESTNCRNMGPFEATQWVEVGLQPTKGEGISGTRVSQGVLPGPPGALPQATLKLAFGQLVQLSLTWGESECLYPSLFQQTQASEQQRLDAN
jgi:hypothetical protein